MHVAGQGQLAELLDNRQHLRGAMLVFERLVQLGQPARASARVAAHSLGEPAVSSSTMRHSATVERRGTLSV
jgi:hypothetical protein